MSELIEKRAHQARLAIQIQTEAKLELLYAEQAVTAAKNGLMSLHDEYMELYNEAKTREENLKARAEEEAE